jgi:hypothetical protein
MKHPWIEVALVGLTGLLPSVAAGQIPALPEGASTMWVVSDPEEIVSWRAFDPSRVSDRLPSGVRFLSLGELSSAGSSWAEDYLGAHPTQREWGVSFLEILRAGEFALDGRSPRWPDGGAVGLWFARIAPAGDTDLGAGIPFLELEFWVPDSTYVAYMRERGHYASYGDVRLATTPSGERRGSVSVEGLALRVNCSPQGPISGGAGSAGTQVLVPPETSPPVNGVVRIAFAGHRERACASDAAWMIQGRHPLATTVEIAAATLQFGYRLVGGLYQR